MVTDFPLVLEPHEQHSEPQMALPIPRKQGTRSKGVHPAVLEGVPRQTVTAPRTQEMALPSTVPGPGTRLSTGQHRAQRGEPSDSASRAR